MIRPIVGPPLSTGIRDLIYENHNKLNFWPNPASDVINVDRNEFPSNVLIYISIIDLTGRELIKVPLTDKIDISRIHEGIYIIVASRNGIPISTSRLIRKK
jgi:hypothetical protein